MADTTVGTPMECAGELVAGRFSGDMTTTGTPLTGASELAHNTASPSGSLAERDASTVATRNFTVLRVTSPSTLSDGDLTTGESAQHVGAETGTLSITATGVTAVPHLPGAISAVRFVCVGSFDEGFWGEFGVMEDVTAQRIVCALGAASASYTVTPWVFGDDPEAAVRRSTADITTKPGGGAWTWTDVEAITSLTVEADYDLEEGSVLGMYLAEVFVEVYGRVGSAREPIALTQKVGGPIRLRTTLGAVL